MKKKLSRHDQEIAYFLNTQEGITQKKLSDLYDVSPAAMSGYIKEMRHQAEKSFLFRSLQKAYQDSGLAKQLPSADFIDVDEN